MRSIRPNFLTYVNVSHFQHHYGLNHLEPHICTAFGFIGIDDIRFIYCRNYENGGEKLEQSIREILEEIEEIVEVL